MQFVSITYVIASFFIYVITDIHESHYPLDQQHIFCKLAASFDMLAIISPSLLRLAILHLRYFAKCFQNDAH